MKKILDLNKTIFDISQDNPDILEIMKEIGFEDISKPGMINTAGRIMTIYKGARMKKIDIEHIKKIFKNKGYEIIE
jgi:hypothetical protein